VSSSSSAPSSSSGVSSSSSAPSSSSSASTSLQFLVQAGGGVDLLAMRRNGSYLRLQPVAMGSVVKVLDSRGRLVLASRVQNGALHLDLTGAPIGIYVVRSSLGSMHTDQVVPNY